MSQIIFHLGKMKRNRGVPVETLREFPYSSSRTVAILTSSASDFACIFSITLARCTPKAVTWICKHGYGGGVKPEEDTKKGPIGVLHNSDRPQCRPGGEEKPPPALNEPAVDVRFPEIQTTASDPGESFV